MTGDLDRIPRATSKAVAYLKDVFWGAIAAPACGFALLVLLSTVTRFVGDSSILLLSACIASGFAYWRYRRGKVTNWSAWAWALPALWLVLAIASEAHYPPARGRFWWYVGENYFSNNCAGGECLGRFFFTAPLYSSIAYSIVAWLLRRTHRRNPATQSR